MKYKIKDRVFGIGNDYWIEDEHGDKAFLVDGKALRVRETFELKDRNDRLVARVHKKMISLKPTMVIERDDDVLAVVKKDYSFFREHFTVEFDGDEWRVKGNFTDHEFVVESDQGELAAVSRSWFSMRDTYGVEVPDGYPDHALLLAVAVAVERLNEEAHEHG